MLGTWEMACFSNVTPFVHIQWMCQLIVQFCSSKNRAWLWWLGLLWSNQPTQAHRSITQYCVAANDTQVISSMFSSIVDSYIENFAASLGN